MWTSLRERVWNNMCNCCVEMEKVQSDFWFLSFVLYADEKVTELFKVVCSWNDPLGIIFPLLYRSVEKH